MVSLFSTVVLLTHLHVLVNDSQKFKIHKILLHSDFWLAEKKLMLLSNEPRHYEVRWWSHWGANWSTLKTAVLQMSSREVTQLVKLSNLES